VALAKRSPERAGISMQAFVFHPSPWVRMYAAGAAAVTGDLRHLEKLATDVDDNVREAALVPLRQLEKADANPAILAALDRDDVQLLRTAAMQVKEWPKDPKLFPPLMAALLRVWKASGETSRDARLPLMEAIDVHGTAENARELRSLLTDVDPKVAGKASDVIAHLTGKREPAVPSPAMRGWPQAFGNLKQCLTVSLASGGTLHIRMAPSAAPVAVDRIMKLAADGYYDGLEIHRVVPNFVIQAGSPHSNEYSGHREYMRDEVSASNVRGTVGLSTRGRNTGDGQFYINLVDNRRLDADYTVFANVIAADMPIVDRIEEGDVMRTVRVGNCPLVR
jgi:cyclophilin family peptidyl-prolyl cis-trans isomerase